MNYDMSLERVKFKIHGHEVKFNAPIIDNSSVIVRPATSNDLSQFQDFNDKGLATDLSVVDLERLVETGLTYLPDRHGIIPFVVIDRQSEEVLARAYLKAWDKTRFIQPKYELNTDGGYNVITAADMVNEVTQIIEIGGVLVKPQHRQKGLLKVLTYERLMFLKCAEEKLGNKLYETLFLVNVGVLQRDNNENGVDYADRLYSKIQSKGLIEAKTMQDLTTLAGRGEILTHIEVAEIFSDLKVYKFNALGQVVHGPYEFGTARKETLGAQKLTATLVDRQPLVQINRKGMPSPHHFSHRLLMHTGHGGRYIVSSD